MAEETRKPKTNKKVRTRYATNGPNYQRYIGPGTACYPHRKGELAFYGCNDQAYDGEDMYEVLPGTYDTYRRMDRNPYLAMAREWKLGPVFNAEGMWMSKPGTPDTHLKFIQESIEPLVADLLQSLAEGFSMGNSPNTILWDLENKPIAGVPNVHYIVREIRPVDPNEVRVRVSESDDWQFLGLNIRGQDFDPAEVVYFRHQPRRYSSYWWFGRSLHENIRPEYSEHEADRQMIHRLGRKLSGVVAIANVIKGMAKDSKGNTIDRMAAAMEIVNYLATSMGVAFENVAFSEDEIRKNPKLADVRDISVEALDLGSSAPAYDTMLKKRNKTAQELVMGWGMGPRAMMESEHNSRADSEEQTTSSLTQSEVAGLAMHRVLNEQVVDLMLTLNFGPDAKGSVWREPTRFTEAQRKTSAMVMNAIVNNPVIFASALEVMDQAAIFKASGVKLLNNVDTVKMDLKESPLKPEPKPVPPGKPMKRDITRRSNNAAGSNGR